MNPSTKKWRAVICKLRKRFHVSVPVAVRRRQTKGDFGVTTFDGRTFQVCIASNQSAAGQIDTLLHEWAHVMEINAAYGHGKSWGKAYSRVYKFHENNYRIENEK